MKRALLTLLLLAAPLIARVHSQSGQNVAGTVFNMTAGAPLAHVQIKLLQLAGSMKTVATAVTGAQGRYRFSENSTGPFMVEVDYQGVPYFAQVQDGQAETNVQVYDALADPSQLKVGAEIMVLQPDQGQLAVVNEYRVENDVQPPKTLYTPQGMFRFRAPAGAAIDMVRVVAPGEMPLARSPRPAGAPGLYRVNSPLRPGQTRIQVSYRIPYSGLKAALTETPVVPPAHFEVYVPAPMTFSGAGFAQVGAQDGYTVYGAEPSTGTALPASFTFQVAGNAPLPAAAGQANAASASAGASNAAAAPADSAAAAEPPAASTPAPTFIERNLWMILALLGLAAAAGFGILMARPEAAVVIPAPSVTVVGPTALPAAPVNALAGELSRLKDDLFLLEVRRHVRDITEPDYARLRADLSARMDKLAGK
jgi:5-hydroxyisourate hydrolase-like protein (transthyretin family)